MVVVIYLVAVQKKNVDWLSMKKTFGYRITSIFVGWGRFATLFRQRAMSAKEYHDIFSILHTLYLVLVPIHITKNSINTPNLLVL